MSRFNLSKGERFSFAKDEGLNNLTVTLGWEGENDLDASTFLVGEDGVIEDEANFVYYNSAKRSEEFDRAKRRMYNRYSRALDKKTPSEKDLTLSEYYEWLNRATAARDQFVKGELSQEEALSIINVP